MPVFKIEFQRGAVHLPELGLWLDAHDPQSGQEQVFVSHAHSDHIETHREVILSAPTSKLMRARLGGDSQRIEHELAFGARTPFQYEQKEFQLTLLPAGHIFGSAMSLLETEGESLLYTGDFKLRRGLSAEPCEPKHADILIMETTFGRPQYVFPPAEAVIQSVIRFCREALDNDETPVLLGYSLGKSQELLRGLGEAGLPLMLHGAVHNLTQIYEQFGQCFPKYERYEAGSARGKVLLCPPNVTNSAMLRNLGKTRSAILTGWAVDPNCRYRYQCDAAFALSDHADFPDLIEFVKQVQPGKVFTLHGFAADFARTLRGLGFDAQALSENEQLALALECGSRPGIGNKKPHGTGLHSRIEISTETTSLSSSHPEFSQTAFLKFAETCAAIAGTSGKLEKVRILSEYLRDLSGDAVGIAATWFSGRPFAASQNKVLQLGWAALRDALGSATETDETTFHQIYLKHSDLGETARELLEERIVRSSLSIEQVDELFHKLQAARGPLAKRPLLAAAFEKCSALEAKFLVKIITGDLRIGLKEGLVEEAVASAFSKTPEEVRQANLLIGDIGETAKLAAAGNLSGASLIPFRPIKFMLASPEETAADIWERVQSADLHSANSNGKETTVWIEDKYDGVRCQLHQVGARVALFSRDLKDITNTFMELGDAARLIPDDLILDGEILAMSGDEVLPFADLQKRLGRREHDLFMREEVPIKFIAFDLLWLKGKSFLNEPLKMRRAALERLTLPDNFRLARITDARSADEIEHAFSAARQRGNEGLMVKNPASVYLPGRRGLAWLKLKKALATLDCVVVGAEYGHGKRGKVLSDYTFAVRDERSGELKTIGKAYSGLTDVEIAQLTKHFLTKAIRQRGRYFEVEPDTVLEIAFDRVQNSARHNSGLAMRFPRIARIRTDKSLAEIDTLETARRLVK